MKKMLIFGTPQLDTWSERSNHESLKPDRVHIIGVPPTLFCLSRRELVYKVENGAPGWSQPVEVGVKPTQDHGRCQDENGPIRDPIKISFQYPAPPTSH